MNNNIVTLEHINQLLDNAQVEEHIFWNKELCVSYKLPNGFTVNGRGACVDPANFDIHIGRTVARQDAIDQLFKLEGYLLQQRLYEEINNPINVELNGLEYQILYELL